MKAILGKIWKALKLPTGYQLFVMRRVNDVFLIGVTGIIFDSQDRILLFKHSYRDNGYWSLPGGYIKSKEHPKEALEREIKEESGLIISADERLKLRTDRNTARLDITYIGVYLGGEFVPSDEVEDADFFRFDELPLIAEDQLYFIDKALEYKKNHQDKRLYSFV